MPQLLLPDNIPLLTVSSNTTISLPSTYLNRATRFTIGGQQYVLNSSLILNTATTGLGGLDTGSLAANTLYYIYLCSNSNGVTGLVMSVTGPTTGPTGFANRYLYIGKCRTAFASAILVASAIDNKMLGASRVVSGKPNTDFAAITTTQFGSSNGQAFTNLTISRSFAQRVQENMIYMGRLDATGVPGTGVGGLTVRVSFGELTIDNNKYSSSTFTNFKPGGYFKDSSALLYDLAINPFMSAGNLDIQFNISGSASQLQPAGSVPVAWASGDYVDYTVCVPIFEFAGVFGE